MRRKMAIVLPTPRPVSQRYVDVGWIPSRFYDNRPHPKILSDNQSGVMVVPEMQESAR